MLIRKRMESISSLKSRLPDGEEDCGAPQEVPHGGLSEEENVGD